MKLIAIEATELTPNLIEIYDNKNNKYACVSKFGDMKLFGEDAIISKEELSSIRVISDNFNLFFCNLIRLQKEIEQMKDKIKIFTVPTLSRQ